MGRGFRDVVASRVGVHHDTNLYDLNVKTSHGTAVIHTTSNHLFWDPYPHYGWIPANTANRASTSRPPDGQSAVVVGGTDPEAVHDGWMWDLTVPGNNDHDFYVAVAATAVLVHNLRLRTEWHDSDAAYQAVLHNGQGTFNGQRIVDSRSQWTPRNALAVTMLCVTSGAML